MTVFFLLNPTSLPLYMLVDVIQVGSILEFMLKFFNS